jgi:hypothetical protein
MQFQKSVATWLVIAAIPAVLGNASMAQQPDSSPDFGYEYLGRTSRSSIWLKTDSVAEISNDVRVGVFLSNTAIDVQFTDGAEAVLRSIRIEIQVNCAVGTYVELDETHFTGEFANGRQIWRGESRRQKEWSAQNTVRLGSAMHHVLNSICSRDLNHSRA